MQKETDTDRMGSSYAKNIIASKNPDDCSRACLADNQCLAATYVKPGTFQGPEAWCWMKDSVPASSSCNDCITFVRRGGTVQPPIAADSIIITHDVAMEQYNPTISGNYLIWTGHPPDGGATHDQVYVYDIPAGVTTKLTDDPFDHGIIDVGDGQILWTDNTGIILYNLTTGHSETIFSKPVDDIQCPRLYGDHITWLDRRNLSMTIGGHSNYGLYAVWSGSSEIYHNNLRTAVETRLTENLNEKGCPVFSNGKIAWTELHNGSGQIILLDMQTGNREQVPIGIRNAVNVQISNNRAFWQDGKNISYYNPDTGIKGKIPVEPFGHQSFTTDGDMVIWKGYEKTDSVLQIYDLSSGNLWLVNGTENVYDPTVDGQYLAGILNDDPKIRTGGGNIILYTLPSRFNNNDGKTTATTTAPGFSSIFVGFLAVIILVTWWRNKVE